MHNKVRIAAAFSFGFTAFNICSRIKTIKRFGKSYEVAKLISNNRQRVHLGTIKEHTKRKCKFKNTINQRLGNQTKFEIAWINAYWYNIINISSQSNEKESKYKLFKKIACLISLIERSANGYVKFLAIYYLNYPNSYLMIMQL